MPERYIAFDVETPNLRNDRISAIGITVVEDGRIAEEFYSLVDPQTFFSSFNIGLTGITPDMVKGAPTFPELWEQIEATMGSGVLVAHNAKFDMGLLSKCLRAYDILWQTDAPYACTCTMGRRCYPQLADHKLNTMCAYLGISLDHHRADSDSTACARLLIDYMEHGFSPESFIRSYKL
ncbi:MAG: 3'-5' exonuclease [Oscillospiraceae bacterium]|nr:3'-5' exonuclease [Oscillospiraceae bacterium]